jgi:hypothetical protein
MFDGKRVREVGILFGKPVDVGRACIAENLAETDGSPSRDDDVIELRDLCQSRAISHRCGEQKGEACPRCTQ